CSPIFFLPELREAEQGIAVRLRAIIGRPSTYAKIDFAKAGDWYEAKTGMTLSPSQRQALCLALQSRVLIITGGAGVGKTTLVNAIVKILLAKKVKCFLCAPPGRAAKRLTESTGQPAYTIHRLLRLQQPDGNYAHSEVHRIEAELLIVDEVSMVDVLLMHRLLEALDASASLLLVGDVDQLPSVGP